MNPSSQVYWTCLKGIIWREALRFVHQRERFFAALVRPLIWLLVFATGFRSVLGVSITPPYDTYITYETYIVPGLVAMIQLFNGMQSSLTLVYDREMGSMPLNYWTCLKGIIWREALRFVHQRERFFAALVRPLIWLLVFATGFRSVLGVSITPPYDTYITYETYIVPGLVAMIQLFNGMQSSLTLVYDREMGSMRLLLTSPLPRWYLLLCKLLAGALVSIFQVLAFLIVAELTIVDLPLWGWLASLPVLLASGLMLGAVGMLLSSTIRQLENFAGIMNFVIFPMFFLSSALYPLWKVKESSELLYKICLINPFTYAVESIRFTLYLEANLQAVLIVLACALVSFGLAVWGYDPKQGIIRRAFP